MSRFSILASAALAGLLGLPGALAADGCIDCHSNPEFFVQNRKLHNYYQDWIKSPHAASGLGCSDCHGGDPSATEFQAAHAGVLPTNNPDSTLYYKNQPDTCGTCHSDKLEQFRESKHYEALIAGTLAPTCTTCHTAMNRRPYLQDIVVDACESCHNEENADRLPQVSDMASEYLQRLNIAKGYLGWTRFYYESHGWPGDSKAEVEAIADKYDAAVTRVHRFDLAAIDESSREILADLEVMFQKAWKERQEETQADPEPDTE